VPLEVKELVSHPAEQAEMGVVEAGLLEVLPEEIES
jgi:hypothetical protein